MSSSKSSPTNTTATTTSLTTKNLNVSGNTGFTIAGGDVGSSTSANYTDQSQTTSDSGNTSIQISTDSGAVKAATALSSHALDIVSATNRDSLDFAANLASDEAKATSSVYGNALTAVTDNSDKTTSIITQLATLFGTSLEQNFSDSQTQLGNVVSALNSTYTANNTSANQQVINAVTSAGAQSQQTIKYVALAAVAAVALYFALRK